MDYQIKSFVKIFDNLFQLETVILSSPSDLVLYCGFIFAKIYIHNPYKCSKIMLQICKKFCV